MRAIFESTQLHNYMQRFGPVGPLSGMQCWTLCTKQAMQNANTCCLNSEIIVQSQLFVAYAAC